MFILLFVAFRHNLAVMGFLSVRVVQPFHHTLAVITAKLPFSLAEWLYAVTICTVLIYLIREIILLITRPSRLCRIYRVLIRMAALILGIYAMFCLLWGVYFYGDDFIERSHIEVHKISADELETVTLYFAGMLNNYSDSILRDEFGLCLADKQSILSRSPFLFHAVARDFPCLSGPEVPVKEMFFSKIMSAMDYTGFFCPLTGEANVNTDFPSSLFASTVAHELSHQRSVAKEQEANFVAVLASLYSEDPDFCYSACLLAYIHLSNALYNVHPSVASGIYEGLCEGVKADLMASNTYWAQFQTPVRSITNAAYDVFLKSYEQDLGLRSYGACVDLLVSFYYPSASEYCLALQQEPHS